jgi:hypothetical protein
MLCDRNPLIIVGLVNGIIPEFFSVRKAMKSQSGYLISFPKFEPRT